MEIEIRDTAANGPVYQQIKDQIARLIEAGTLSTGDTLPSPATLAGKTGADRGEISRAYFELEQSGAVVSRKSKNFLGEATTTYTVG